jgi:outer membrane protein, multidrug efflux system
MNRKTGCHRGAGLTSGSSVFALMGLIWTAVFVPGCTVGPDYRSPEPQMPAAFSSGPTTQPAKPSSASRPASSEPVDLTRWWVSLGDPVLDSLVRRAIDQNLDLGIAVARVEEVRAQRVAVAAGLWPVVNVFSGSPGGLPLYDHASGTRNYRHYQTTPRSSVSARQTVGAGGLIGPPSLYVTSPGHHPTGFLVTPGGSSGSPTVNVRPSLFAPKGETEIVGRDQFAYEVGVDAAWELDVFGGVRRAIEVADADVQAAIEIRNDVLVMLLADLARSYVELRGLQQRLDIAQRSISLQRRTLDLVNKRFQYGLTNDLDVALAERQLATTESRVSILEAGIAMAQHRLAVLVGLSPEELYTELSVQKPIPLPPPEVPVGLPSDILRRRPDIRRAERELASATARIGVAVADLYPRFMLSGGFGLQTSDIRRMLDAESLIWSAGPGLRWPIFEGGRLIANVHIQESRAQQSLLNYRRTLLVALQEVDDALASYAGRRTSSMRLREAVRASARAVKLAESRYSKGVTDFLNVLDAQRSLDNLEDQLASSDQDMAVQLVTLYKALGGGWEGYDSHVATRPAT